MVIIIKSNTCEEGGANLGKPKNFFLTFIDELEKQLLKKLLSGAIKNIRILIFTMLYF